MDRPALLKAEEEIARHTTDKDGRWSHARARAELLEFKPDAALRDLEAVVRVQGGKSPAVLIDMATAHVERADMFDLPQENGIAIEALSEALQHEPHNAVALYNRAIVYERTMMFGSAIADWNAYIQLAPDDAWKSDARTRLKALQDRRNPQSWIRRGLHSASAEAIEASFASRLVTDDQECQRNGPAKLRFAAVTVSHSGSWLSDIAVVGGRDEYRSSVCHVIRASRFNDAGDPDSAYQAAMAGLSASRQVGPVAFRARLEAIFALQRMPKPAECLHESQRLVSDLGKLPYEWIREQAQLEASTCEAMLGEIGLSKVHLENAYQRASLAGMRIAALRASGLHAELDATSGNAQDAWRWTMIGLSDFWSGEPSPPMRAYQFYAGLAYLAEKSAMWRLASSLNREALPYINATRNRATEALAQYRLAVDELGAEDWKAASSDFTKAETIFASLPQSHYWRTYRAYSAATRARLELQSRSSERALDVGGDAGAELRNSESIFLRVLSYRILGEVASSRNDVTGAEDSYRKGIDLLSTFDNSESDPAQRIAWQHALEETYRSLTSLYLFQKHDSGGAYSVWQHYRDRIAPPIEGTSNASFSRRTLLTYVVFPDGIALWSQTRDRRTYSFVKIKAADLEHDIESLRRMCSDRNMADGATEAAAQKLYNVLIAPANLEKPRDVAIQTDGAIDGVPFALLFASGWSAVPAIEVVSGAPAATSAFPINTHEATLAVLTGASTDSSDDLPAIPDIREEAQRIASNFGHSLISDAKHTDRAFLERALVNADVVHFVGHAVERGGQTALLLSTSEERGDTYFSSRDLKGIAARCRLVVLAACSTGKDGTDDPDGLRSRLLLAGVKQVVATQWEVDTAATAALMTAFYDGMNRGLAPADALAAGQQSIRQTKGWHKPFFWAGFEVHSRN